MIIPHWIEIAIGELGIHETPGKESTARIDEYLRVVHMSPDDNIPWCAAFANWVLNQANMLTTGRATARSFLLYGKELGEWQYGCLAVFGRPDPVTGLMSHTLGHVGFALAETSKEVLLLGGNQNNSVCCKTYLRSRLLAYRWPT